MNIASYYVFPRWLAPLSVNITTVMLIFLAR